MSPETSWLIIVAIRLFGPSFLVYSVIVATEHCPKHCHCCFDPLGWWIWESYASALSPFIIVLDFRPITKITAKLNPFFKTGVVLLPS